MKVKSFYIKHKKLCRLIIITFIFAGAAGIVFGELVQPYAVYADGTKVEDPKMLTADGKELFLVEDEETVKAVVKDVMKTYKPENGDIESIILEEDLKLEDKTLFIGAKPPTVLTEEEAVAKVLEANKSDDPVLHVTTNSTVEVEESVEPELVYEKTDELFEGNVELKSEGTEGTKIVTNEVTMVNGEEESTEEIEEKLTDEAVDTVMYLGTGERPSDTAWEDYSGTVLGSDDGTKMVSYGKQFVGNSYKYGGSSLTNGTDCSGFIYSVYRHFGYNVPRLGFYKMGKGVCLAEAKAGDVVYYPGHYAMYAGDGKIVHAYNSSAGICVSSVHAPGKILTIRRFVEQ